MKTISNKNLLPEFEAVKDDDENFIWLGKPELKSFLANMLIAGVIGIGFVVAVVIFNINVQKEDENANAVFIYLVLALFFVPATFKYVATILSYKNIVYGFSNKRIMMKSGFIGTDFKMIDYDKIVDIEVKVNPIDRYLNTGTIKFFSGREKVDDEGSSTRLHDEWSNIENVYEVFKQVKKVMVDIKTDYNYPNAKRPLKNPGYNTRYEPE
ncbi:MAG: PH domain-containing protein [Saprospiraceae bacterium]